MTTKRAIISVYDKTGIAEFAKKLSTAGYEIVSSGGTAKYLREQGLTVTDVAEVTGFPEMLDGRVKTLHPRIHAGILARRDVPDHLAKLKEHDILPVDLVVVNLYPFEATVAKPNVTDEEAIENIDIGGPSLIRAAAKNHKDVAVVTDPGQYQAVISELESSGQVSCETKRELAQKAFALTVGYDAAINNYFINGPAGTIHELPQQELPENISLNLKKSLPLRYGENPHQPAGFYLPVGTEPAFEQIHGKEISYNNILDMAAAWELVSEFSEPCCVIVKHTNPCGCACADNLKAAYLLARDGELPPSPISRFGGIIAVNRPLDKKTAEEITGPNSFYEAIAAPEFGDGVKEIFALRKGWGQNVRLVKMSGASGPDLAWRSAAGGWLVQQRDQMSIDETKFKQVTKNAPAPGPMEDLKFAFKVVKHVKSNAIAIVKDKQLIGMGAGQPNRLASVRLALQQAGERGKGAALASDGFFPFADNIKEAAAGGIAAIIQPGGSVKDEDVIKKAGELGLAMLLTGIRHFRH
ncbi:bifunctional phosphoribosylaminoimidazolecarboxamide formyltransferase/IMP cyclohydrolase [candidate division TA06 bacterium]|uniref:Bifunctional purine biosynthesis protein PurH n=1 Tax=candidate division TA06 bacterium TaxID=2250710 RepID=A0A933MKN7_UNCT6|nr:bifunctional phosphoribosylaminoimidazolecarboxamide formyltransferase/IMP cyclohydrolase [candidate division TA06 bacterium]